MNELLILLFVLPLATIIFSIVFEKIIRNPVLVSLFIFAIYLIVAFFTSSEENLALYIIIAIIYAVLAFLTALITRFINRIRCNLRRISDTRNLSNDCCSSNGTLQLTNVENSTITSEYPVEYINYILGNNGINSIR